MLKMDECDNNTINSINKTIIQNMNNYLINNVNNNSDQSIIISQITNGECIQNLIII